MSGFDDEMFLGVDQGFFGASVATPQNKHEMWASFAEIFYSVFGEDFPAFATMRAGKVRLDGEDVVEKQHALVLPTHEAAGFVVVWANVAIDFFVDIDEGWRDSFSVWNGKSQSHGGARSVIGVLAENHDVDII